MQANAGESNDTRKMESGALATSSAQGRDETIDSAVLEKLDVGLFKALRKLDTPKHRVCSALWLSYAEYDELSRMI